MLSKEEVKKVAKLARLGITEEETEKFSKELSSILDYFEKLKKVDVSNVEPTSHPNKAENVIRQDEASVCEEEVRKGIVKQFPEEKDGYIKVKQIL